MNIIREDADCPIKPENIDGKDVYCFMGSVWQNMETEVTAYWLVKFAKQRGSWAPFRMDELLAMYHVKHPDSRFCFNKIMPHNGDSYIFEDGEYLHFTTEFVAAVYALSPAV